jgi:D-alanyl-D-alanine carboxypeptidase/D-alanyl-D-alanine-endopeptidase (penicillin-binding protein 4)
MLATLVGLLCLLAVTRAHAAPQNIKGLGSQDALLVLDPTGQVVFSHNPDRPMVPASTLKVLTSLAAFHYLGADYRFPTDFFLDADHNLAIKGYGDPLLISEIIAPLARELAVRLPSEIHDILLDGTYFEGPQTMPGVSTSTNPYDAPIGALCANFNTVFFTHADGRLQSAEEQTPLLPMVAERIRRSGLKEGRIVLSPDQDEPTRYVGQLFRYFLEREGVVVRGEVRLVTNPVSGASLVYRQLSPYRLPQVVQRLLEYSNNFTANQLLMAMGAWCYGPPATLDKGVRALTAYARDVVGVQQGVFVEGSGISRRNRLSVRDMALILSHFRPHFHLMTSKNREFYKTGTLKGVRTRVGYIEVQSGQFYSFALFRNRPGSTTDPVMRQVHRALSAHSP